MEFNFSLVSESEALATLGVDQNDPEVLSDRVEEMVFPLRDYFLRNPVIIPLYKSRINRLLNIQTAALSLKILSSKNQLENQCSAVNIWPESFNSHIELFRKVEAIRAEIRLKMAQTLVPAEIASWANELCVLETAYMDSFLMLNSDLVASTEQVKASEFPDFGELIFELNSQSDLGAEMLSKEKSRILLIRDRSH